MNLVLKEVSQWNGKIFCAPTALAAISGLSPDEVGEFLKKAIQYRGGKVPDGLREDYNRTDWMCALTFMGYEVEKDIDEEFSYYPFMQSIAEYISSVSDGELRIAFCVDENEGRSHVFAHQGRCVVDCYTKGMVVENPNIPKDYLGFRLKCSWKVRLKGGAIEGQ